MRPRISVDTSVFGGCEDVEFIGHSRRLAAAMIAGDYSMAISEVTLLELEKAPAPIQRAGSDMSVPTTAVAITPVTEPDFAVQRELAGTISRQHYAGIIPDTQVGSC